MRTVSIIIPAYKEGYGVVKLAKHFENIPGVQIVAALAEDDDETTPPVGPAIFVVRAKKGRASQMNAGAEAANGENLLFLHADTMIDPASLGAMQKTLDQPGVAGGAYSLRFDQSSLALRLISAVANLRSKWLKLPYGDQALFMTRETFNKIGGFDDIPIMEDVRMVENIRKEGKLIILDDYATTSARKWRKGGVLKNTLRNWKIMAAYKMGVKPENLVKQND